MHDNLLHFTFTFTSFSKCFCPTYIWRLGKWTKLEDKTSVSSVCPPRTLTWFQSSICVCDETDPRVSAGVSGYSAESIHARRRRIKMSFETEQLQAHICCASPPSVPVSQSERGCQARLNEQNLDLWLDRSICKRTPQALFWERFPQMMKENHLRGRWGAMLLFMGSWVSAFLTWSLFVYFKYFLVEEMSSSGSYRYS